MMLLGILACVSSERIAEEQDVAILAAGDALAASLIAAELLSHADDPPSDDPGLRHEGVCGCPCTSRIGSSDSYVQELDYDTPTCLPSSGLLPTGIGGHVWLDRDGGDVHLSRSQAVVGSDLLTLDLDGTWEGPPSAWRAVASGPIAVDTLEGQVDQLTLVRQGDGLSLDGGAQGGTLTDVQWAGAPSERDCPAPDAGTFTLGEAVVTFLGEGMEVDWRGNVATVSACDAAPDFF